MNNSAGVTNKNPAIFFREFCSELNLVTAPFVTKFFTLLIWSVGCVSINDLTGNHRQLDRKLCIKNHDVRI